MDRKEQLRRNWYESGYESLGINAAQVEHNRRKAARQRITATNWVCLVILAAWIVAIIVW